MKYSEAKALFERLSDASESFENIVDLAQIPVDENGNLEQDQTDDGELLDAPTDEVETAFDSVANELASLVSEFEQLIRDIRKARAAK